MKPRKVMVVLEDAARQAESTWDAEDLLNLAARYRAPFAAPEPKETPDAY